MMHLQDRCRVSQQPIRQHLEVQVCSCCHAGASGQRNTLPFPELTPLLHQNFTAMAVPGFNIGTMAHPHIVSIDAIVADFCDCAGQCRHNRCTLGSGNVNSRMEVPLTVTGWSRYPNPDVIFPLSGGVSG